MDGMIVRVDRTNYSRFADMVFWREHGFEREPSAVPAPEELCDPNLYVYAAEEDGRFVGWISLVYLPKVSRVQHGYVYVDELWVQPEYRRRGIARALMDKAEEVKELRNAVGIRLYVNVENPGAKGLYERCGYREDGAAYFMEKGFLKGGERV